MKLISFLIPCQKICQNPTFITKHKVLTLQAQIEEKDKPHYIFCKECDIFLYTKFITKGGSHCPCCRKKVCHVYKKSKRKDGAYYEY